MSTSNDMFWEIVKTDFSWFLKEKEPNDDYRFYSTKEENIAQVLMCNSFYDLFIKPFSQIQIFKYRSNVKLVSSDFDDVLDEEDYDLKHFNTPIYLEGENLRRWEFSENLNFMAFLSSVINSRTPKHYLTTNRGNAFFFTNSSISEDDLKKNGFDFEYYQSGVFGSKRTIQFILIQYETRSYGLLPLINTTEVEFNPKKHYFSFAVNYFNDDFHDGDIFFYSFEGLEFSRKNVINIINKYLVENSISETPANLRQNTDNNILEFDHQFNRYKLRTRVTFFKETEFIYTVRVGETINAGRLREDWVGITIRINFFNDEILEFNGSKSLESLK